jgi:AcrR family transcriptional regulator
MKCGRQLFAEKGFGGTGTAEIVSTAGVTRGALYHHYADKTALFLAVFESVERDLMAELASRIQGLDDPVEMLRKSAEAFLDLCQSVEIRQIALLDAPSVLGWEKWREVEARHGLGMLRMLLQHAKNRGLLPDDDVDHLAHILLGAVSEAAMVVAHHPDDPVVRARMGKTLTWMIEQLLAGGQRE